MEDEQKKLEYAVPRKIRLGYEFAPGWGWQQVIASAIGLAIGVILFFLIGIILHKLHAKLIYQVMGLILSAGAGVLISRQQTDGTTGLDMIMNWRKWNKKQKLYLYDFSRDDF